MHYKQEIAGLVFKRTKAVIGKIKELKITPKMSDKALEKLIIKQSKAKAKAEGGSYLDYIGGQEWYLTHLRELSSLGKEGIYDKIYEELYVENSGREEHLELLPDL